MNAWHDKIIVITGASSGIGQTTALLTAQLGAIPILLARSEDALATLTDRIQPLQPDVSYYVCDVTDENQIEDVVNRITERYGKIDIWVNNAGYGVFGSVLDAQMEDIIGMMDVNYLGVVRCTRAILPHMKKRQQGHIINVASIAGKLATPNSSAYSASKFAVIGYTHSVRAEVKPFGVYVSAVNPGPVRTPFFDRADTSGSYRQSVEKFMIDPETVARGILKAAATGQAEVTLPRYMRAGVVLHHVFPRLFERLIGPFLNRK
ncbi:hypothetical protein DFP93_13237 [Aneurinibacillus soli]|uniref:Putative oxidoreductase SadH n=1 Tax=Aneurinibacillus soli TaxID=1500254 RepID=A0A0U5AZT7_9BACL|nr:SDR family oxidoreductase [Aneurinibacillus soli]PYE57278.1 hypothetical protein DFP93_13237 [Aneurinibacillus soli]BAU29274.1 putative oxidoreductase SadH [Aneurinibacillus soli]